MVRTMFITLKKHAKSKKYAVNKFHRKQEYKLKKTLWKGLVSVLVLRLQKEERAYSHFMMTSPFKYECFRVLKKINVETKARNGRIRAHLKEAKQLKVFEQWKDIA
mmetsp:Transcript_13367/g.20895  ORF Transcript_13367/g.20895 Transcript_13367/m.20895 type:complete len:106 (+) Transcript_13367:1274-1591(+)